jgi:hypothetical protein
MSYFPYAGRQAKTRKYDKALLPEEQKYDMAQLATIEVRSA